MNVHSLARSLPASRALLVNRVKKQRWEQSDKPPRSDVLPKLARVLGVSVEDAPLRGPRYCPEARPVGRMQKLFAKDLPSTAPSAGQGGGVRRGLRQPVQAQGQLITLRSVRVARELNRAEHEHDDHEN